MERNAEHPRTAYRAFVVNEQGRLGGLPQIIEADSDRDAARMAQGIAGWNAVELWEGARLVARVMPKRGAVPPPEVHGIAAP